MICGHQNRKVLRAYGQTRLFECCVCGLIFQSQDEKKQNQAALYEDYYKNETGGRFNFGIEYVIRMFRFFRALKILSICYHAKTILDIGSGRGFMLYYLKKYFGYSRACGTQLSRNAVEFSRKKLGLEIYDKDFLEIPFGDEQFDVISLWHVLEHVPVPELYIEKIEHSLKENGRLVIEVPNFDSWTAGFTGVYWLGLDPRYHLHFFSPRTLIRLLEKYKFSIKNVHTFSLEYSAFISAQSIISFLTRSDMLFFEWLQTGRPFPGLLRHILLFLLFFPFCLLVNLLLFFSRRGEVLLIVAQKSGQTRP